MKLVISADASFSILECENFLIILVYNRKKKIFVPFYYSLLWLNT